MIGPRIQSLSSTCSTTFASPSASGSSVRDRPSHCADALLSLEGVDRNVPVRVIMEIAYDVEEVLHDSETVQDGPLETFRWLRNQQNQSREHFDSVVFCRYVPKIETYLRIRPFPADRGAIRRFWYALSWNKR